MKRDPDDASDPPAQRPTGRQRQTICGRGSAAELMAQKNGAAVVRYVPRKAFVIEGEGLSTMNGRAIATVATGAETAAARVIQAAEQRSNLNDHIDVEALAATLRDRPPP